MLDWDVIKNKLYFLDGSLRDILVYNMGYEEWSKWIDYVNVNYVVKFKNYSNDEVISKIDYSSLKEKWNIEGENIYYYSLIDLGGIFLNCYFNDPHELNQDFCPTEIKTIVEHNRLIKYLQDISLLLNKEVVFTEEMNEDMVLMKIDEGKIDIR